MLSRPSSITPDQQDLLRTATPLAASAFSFALMSAVDTAFVTRLGVPALAGVGLGGTLAFAAIIPAASLLRGLKICIAQARGRGEPTEGLLGAGLKIAALATLPTWLVMVALGFATQWLLVTEASATAAREYIWIRSLAVPVQLGLITLREGFYGRADTRTPMRAIIAANVLNLTLDWLTVEVLHWGVRGVALTTVLSVSMQLIWLTLAQRPLGFGLSQATRAHADAIRAVGAPMAGQKVLETGAFAGIATMISRTGDSAAAAHQIGLQLLLLGNLPSVALSDGVSIVAGRLFGAGDTVGARRLTSFALRVGLVWTCCVGTLAASLAPSIGPRLVPGDPEVLVVIWACSALLVLEATSLVAQGYLRATGDPRYPSAIVMSNALFVSPPLCALGIFAFGLGASAGWLAFLVEVSSSSLFLWRRIRQRTALLAMTVSPSALPAAEVPDMKPSGASDPATA